MFCDYKWALVLLTVSFAIASGCLQLQVGVCVFKHIICDHKRPEVITKHRLKLQMGYLKLWNAFRNYKQGIRNFGSIFRNYKWGIQNSGSTFRNYKWGV
jgi:hypothetical protein